MVSLSDHKPDVLDATGIELRRSFEAAEINAIVNHPAIFPLVALPGLEEIDCSPLVSDPRNVLLIAEGGCFLFTQDEPGIYEVHTNFLPEHRGKNVILAAKEAAKWMFTHTDAMILQTRVPIFNKAALVAIKWCGFDFWFERKGGWLDSEGKAADVKYYRLSHENWIDKSAEMVAAGELFHARLDSEYSRHGRKPHSHPEDPYHDRQVGLCFETIFAGQPDKAVILYNRWARIAGYQQISLISRSPLIIDIGEALLLASENNFKVIKCRLPQG